MPAYLITGPNGSGKSTVGAALKARGYNVIETDFAEDLAGWFDTATGELVSDLPSHPFPQAWLNTHSWLWRRPALEKLIHDYHGKDVFFVGGAYNQKEMYDLFTKWFALYIDRATAVKRLQGRGEGRRWESGSAELERSLAWHEKSKAISDAQGGVTVDGNQTPEKIADEIVTYSNTVVTDN